MMNRFLFIIFLSYIFSNVHNNHRCNFSDSSFFHIVRSRPDLDTSILSPTGHFKIHYDTIGVDAPVMDDTNDNNIPDYIEEVGIIADSSRKVIVDIMGFYSEPDDDDGIYDIYIEDRGSGSYGFNAIDNQQTGSSYIVIDDEYEESDYYIPGLNTMRLTVAHEFFHAVQRAYRIYPNTSGYFYEMSSTWIEDVIVPDGNDYIFWVDNFFNNPDQDIDDTNGYSIALYGHYLTQVIEQEPNQMSSSIIREIWEYFQNVNNAHVSIDNILNSYESSFSETWVDFCTRNLFNGRFPDMNNNIYYYSDQIITSPIQTSPSILNQDQYIEDVIINNKSISPLISYDSNDFFILNHNSSLPTSNYFGQIVIDRYNNNVDIYEIDNDISYNINKNDKIHLVYSSYNNPNTQLMDIDILLENCDINDPPEGFCDCSGNILDECGICAGSNECFPSKVDINKIYPNPSFDNIINIQYEIPRRTNVLIILYDSNGKLINTITNEIQDGREAPYIISYNAEKLSSGIYLVNLIAENVSISKWVTLIK